MGLIPQVNPIEDIAHVVDRLTGMTLPLPFGWIGHFFLGTVAWGIIYAVLRASLPGTPVVKSLIFATLAWLAMMMAAMQALERAPWQGEFDPIEGIILHGAMPNHPAAAE
jgi:hypothetical protein